MSEAQADDKGAEGTPQFTPEEQAMIEKGRAGFSEETPNQDAPQRPEGVPEKFWKDGAVDTEALLKSYTELEKRASAPKDQAPKDEAPASKDGKIEKAKEAAETPAAKALIETAASEWEAGGEITAETIAKLDEVGIPKEIVDLYLEGVKAMTEKTLGEIHSYAGGAEGYTAMSKWAAEKLSDQELDAYNAALENPQLRETAVRGLYARFTSARPSEGAFVAPAGGNVNSGDVFTSRDDLVAAQKDPRYNTDKAYRAEVEAKLARSQQAGFRVNKDRMFPSVYRK